MEDRRTSLSTLSRRAAYDEEVSLAEYVAELWNHKLVLLGTAGLAAVVTLMIDLNRSPVYQATSKLLLSASKIGAEPQTVSIATYQAMVSSQTLVAETLDELGLSREPHKLNAPQALVRNLSVHAIPDTSVIQISARLGDPGLAAQLANRLAEKAVALARQASQDDTVSARDTIKLQLDESRERLDRVEGTLEAFQRKASIEAVQADVDAMLQERARLLPLKVEIEAQRARVQQLTEELGKQERVRDVRSATVAHPDSEAERGVPAEKESPTPARRTDATEKAASGLKIREDLRDPFVNPVYELLEQQLAESRAKLSALEKEHATIARATNASEPADRKLATLYSSKADLSRLEMERDLARRVYLDISSQYEQARIQVASRSAQLQVIDRAVPSNTRIAPRVLRDTVAAVAAALIVASAAILLLAALRKNSPAR